MILYWWMPFGLGFLENVGVVAAGLVVGWLLVALLTKPRELKKYNTYRTDLYGNKHKVGEHEEIEFGTRGWATLLVTAGLLLHWPGFVALALTGAAVLAAAHLARGVFKLVDRVKSVPQRKRELRKKAEREANQWWITHLDELDSAWKEYQKMEAQEGGA